MEELRGVPFDELQAFDGHVFYMDDFWRGAYLSVAVEDVSDIEKRVLFQGNQGSVVLPFLKNAFVDGFRIEKNGSTTHVSYDEVSHLD